MNQVVIDDDIRIEHGVIDHVENEFGTLWIGERWSEEDLREREIESKAEYYNRLTPETWEDEEGAWLDRQR